MILAYTLLKKKKTRFHNYKETSILFLEKYFLQWKWGLLILITGTKFQFTKKTNFYNFYLQKKFPNQIYSEREIFTTFIFFRVLLKQFLGSLLNQILELY